MGPEPVDPAAALEVDDASKAYADRVATRGLSWRSPSDFSPSARRGDEGNVADAIVELARQRDVAAIVVGSRGLSGLRARLEGSTSNAVAKHASCPVVLVHDVEFCALVGPWERPRLEGDSTGQNCRRYRDAAVRVARVTAVDGALAKKKALPPIHVRGTVYTFDDQTPIAGATVRVAELPGLSAQTGLDGSYDLLVSDGTMFTPYADAVGHHRIYLETCVSQGKDLGRVNFQMPSDAAYNGLAAILSVPRDANNELVNCAVVSTFSTVNVRDATFNEFVAYGAHGVAGATASASPALPNPTYFNESVIPDASRTESSIDGGVVWPVVPSRGLSVRGPPSGDPFRPVPRHLRARSGRQRQPASGVL